jgi:hypothetical protein
LLGAFVRVSRDRKAVPSAVVLLCACPRVGAGMVQLKTSENLGFLDKMALSFLSFQNRFPFAFSPTKAFKSKRERILKKENGKSLTHRKSGLWWEIGEARHCYLREGAGDGVFVDLCQAEVKLRQLHLLCQSEMG